MLKKPFGTGNTYILARQAQSIKASIHANELFLTHHRSQAPSPPATGNCCLCLLLTGCSVKAWKPSGTWIETSRTCHPATKQFLSHMCAALCLKYPSALAFVMFRACGLQLQNLLPKLMRQCFPDSLWLNFSLIVFLLLFFCCYFQGSAPANPGSVVKIGPHGKQLPLLWDLTSSPPPSLSLGLYILVYITKNQI